MEQKFSFSNLTEDEQRNIFHMIRMGYYEYLEEQEENMSYSDRLFLDHMYANYDWDYNIFSSDPDENELQMI